MSLFALFVLFFILACFLVFVINNKKDDTIVEYDRNNINEKQSDNKSDYHIDYESECRLKIENKNNSKIYEIKVDADEPIQAYMFLEVFNRLDDRFCLHVFDMKDYKKSRVHARKVFYENEFIDNPILLDIISKKSSYKFYRSEATVKEATSDLHCCSIKDKVDILLLSFFRAVDDYRDKNKKEVIYNNLMVDIEGMEYIDDE